MLGWCSGPQGKAERGAHARIEGPHGHLARRWRALGGKVVALVAAGLVSGCGAFGWLGFGGDGESAARGGQRAPSGDLVIRCESRDGTYQTCPAQTSGGVRLLRQTSTIRCQENRSWGVEDGQIWVDFGCGGEFQLVGTAPAVAATAAAPAGVAGGQAAIVPQLGSPEEQEAVRACATYADFKVRDQGADGGRPDRVVNLRRVAERHYTVQAYIRIAYSEAYLRDLEREDKPRPRDVFFIDCETLRGQVLHFEYNNFL